jgi:predicted O-linked N-acetylglucosamine transferase (SPINDLY family)
VADIHSALQLARSGDVGGAKTECLRVLAAAPDEIAALNLLAQLHALNHEHSAAVDCLERIARLTPQDAAAHRRLGNARFEAQAVQEAISSFRTAIALEPASLAAHNNLGRALARTGDSAGARASYQHALRLDPNYAVGHANLAGLLAASGERASALEHFERAVALRPDLAEAWINYAKLLLDLNRADDALACCARALARNPASPEALYVRAGCLHDLKRFREALQCCDQALALRPQYADAHYSRAKILRDAGDWRGSVAGYDAALRADPGFAAARLARAIASIPALPENVAEIEQSRAAFAAELAALEGWLKYHPCQDPTLVVGAIQPFFLAYQQRDNRELLSAYGKICADLMREWQSANHRVPSAAPAHRRSRLRIGIVSAQIRDHSVFNPITRGWLEHLDRRHVEISIFYLGATVDSQTELARARANEFELGNRSLIEWVGAIAAREVDILIYPELGMNRLTLQLACMRLAPVQMVAWGHPETSGLPTIDYYLSAAAFEPPDADRYYSERLVRMPNLGSYYQITGVEPAADLDRFKIDHSAAVFLCAGTPFKYSPEHDDVFVDIARRLGRCQFHFFEYRDGALSRRLLERIARRFAAADIDPAPYIRLQPRATQAEFHALMHAATAQLDTIGFSGFNTVMQAMECGLPVATQRGRFHRGRFGSGILERVGATELIAEDDAGYVAVVVRLAQDDHFRAEMRKRITERREILYRDREAIQGLQEFLLSLPPMGRGTQ